MEILKVKPSNIIVGPWELSLVLYVNHVRVSHAFLIRDVIHLSLIGPFGRSDIPKNKVKNDLSSENPIFWGFGVILPP